MITKMITSIIAISGILLLSGCKNKDINEIYLCGQLEINEDHIGPAFIAISRSDDFEEIINNPENSIVDILRVEDNDYTFNIDLTGTGFNAGDKITIIGFVDNDYNNGLPYPTEGDYVGFYYDSANWSYSYILKEGYNAGMNIRINRMVYSFESKIKGIVFGDYEGDLTLIAYAGEINSLDVSDFNFDNIIGYNRLNKSDSPLSYTLKIMPYGYDVPIQNVFVIAMLDRNSNGKPDAGDIIGFHTSNENKLPTLISIGEGSSNNKNIELMMEISNPSEYDRSISGTIEMPGGEAYDEKSNPVFLVIANTDDPNLIIKEPVDRIKYFKKLLPPKDGMQSIDFNIDLSKTDLKAGDTIFLLALWDKDYTGGFPNPTLGDYVGFYLDINSMSPSYTLRQDDNEDLSFRISRKIYTFDSEIKGTILGDDIGEATIIAYAGEINSLDYKYAFDVDSIIGYKRINKNEGDLNYTLKIMPYGYDLPIQNVYLFAFLDKNVNKTPDSGDKIGFYTSATDDIPKQITVKEGSTSNKNIDMIMDMPQSSGYDITLSGSFECPEAYDENSKPIYIIIAQTDDLNALLDDPHSAMKYFYRMPPGETNFNVALSSTDIKPGDKVFVLALWDKDYTGGFPDPTEGDYIGFLQKRFDIGLELELSEGVNHVPSLGHVFRVNRKIYNHNSSITLNLDMGDLSEEDYQDGDKVILLAIKSMGINLLLSGNSITDYVLGSTTVNIDFDTNYNIKISPAILDDMVLEDPFGIEGIYIAAILDNKPHNGLIDIGENIGYYYYYDSLLHTYFPKTMEMLTDGENILDAEVRFSPF
ncbi:MAG: hypothetical protein SVZ03_05035 [Spirochaetota bacterium]|nr:hypothetical protein [Spirochaetota bacterium]